MNDRKIQFCIIIMVAHVYTHSLHQIVKYEFDQNYVQFYSFLLEGILGGIWCCCSLRCAFLNRNTLVFRSLPPWCQARRHGLTILSADSCHIESIARHVISLRFLNVSPICQSCTDGFLFIQIIFLENQSSIQKNYKLPCHLFKLFFGRHNLC